MSKKQETEIVEALEISVRHNGKLFAAGTLSKDLNAEEKKSLSKWIGKIQVPKAESKK